MATDDTSDFERRFTLLYPVDILDTEDHIYKDTVSTTLRKLLLGMYSEHNKLSMNSDTDSDQGTTRSLAGVNRSHKLHQHNREDILAGRYAGVFKIAEYFTRSFDAVKGKYFETVIAQEDPDERLVPEVSLSELPTYLSAPESRWNEFSYTEAASEDDATTEYTVDFIGENNGSASADAIKSPPNDERLIFGEHRSTVVTGGEYRPRFTLPQTQGTAGRIDCRKFDGYRRVHRR